MEEASRYAGGYSDPARLLTAFAGVTGSPDNNGVSVHGNAPESLSWRLEAYYQQLYDLPVGLTGTYCTLNRRDFYVDWPLVSRGKGRNYGIDLTLERFMKHSYYYMLNGSLYKAEYRAADGIWRNTRYNRTYLLKLMGGKEWMMSAKRRYERRRFPQHLLLYQFLTLLSISFTLMCT